MRMIVFGPWTPNGSGMVRFEFSTGIFATVYAEHDVPARWTLNASWSVFVDDFVNVWGAGHEFFSFASTEEAQHAMDEKLREYGHLCCDSVEEHQKAMLLT